MKNPYNFDFESRDYYNSIIHTHHHEDIVENSEENKDEIQKYYDEMYNRGIRHISFSEYSPAMPTYPLEDYLHELDNDIIDSPNSEHRPHPHIIALGSLNKFDRDEEEYTRQSVIRDITDNLQYSDGGGLFYAHPNRSRKKNNQSALLNIKQNIITWFMQYQEYFLGLEIYNYRAERWYSVGKNIDIWNQILFEGYQCFGSCVPDLHDAFTDKTEGLNVVMPKSNDNEGILNAYRQGNFFGAIHGTGLYFDNISADSDKINVKTNEKADITFIIGKINEHYKNSKIKDVEKITKTDTTSANYKLTGDEIFVRIEADGKEELEEGNYWSQPYETIYSNPIIYTDADEINKLKTKRRLLIY